MREKLYETDRGQIHYWVSEPIPKDKLTLVFLPGLTADHRLFEKQIEHFEGRYPLLVWDAPGHASSWPFDLDFSLMDKARWLWEILQKEHIEKPVIVGQSMGGYVGQALCGAYPDTPKGFISIDSAPLQREYVTALEIWLLRKMEPVYHVYPWRLLLSSGTKGVATTPYGRDLMRRMMMTYDGDQARYAKLSGHGYRMLADALAAAPPHALPCPALLLCGEKDRAGSCLRYNKAWHKRAGIPLHFIPGAGHNANTDAPEIVNTCIQQFLSQLEG